MSKGYDIMGKVIYFNNRKVDTLSGGGFMKKMEIIEMMAKNVLLSHEITDFPVNPIAIAKEEKIATKAIDMEKVLKEHKILGIIRKNKEGEFIIAVDNKLSANEMRFTIAHELGHYYLNHLKGENNQIVEFHRDSKNDVDIIEKEASRFASALLMDADTVKMNFNILKGANSSLEFIVSILAKFFAVTESDMKNRLHELELVL